MSESHQKVKYGICPCCKRETYLTFHHYIPRKMHRRTYYKKHYQKQELNRGIDICRKCHDGIHDLYDEMRLAKDFNHFDALMQDEALQRHFKWVGKLK